MDSSASNLEWDLEASGGLSMLFGLFALIVALAVQEIIMLASGLGPFELGGKVFFGVAAWVLLIIVLVAAFLVSGALLTRFDRLMKRWGKTGSVTLQGTRLCIQEGEAIDFDLSAPMTIEATWSVLAYKDERNQLDPISTVVFVNLRQFDRHSTISTLEEMREFRGFGLPRIQEGPDRDLELSKHTVGMKIDHVRQMLSEISKRRL